MKIYFTNHVVRVLFFSVFSIGLFAQSLNAQTVSGKIISKQDGLEYLEPTLPKRDE